MCSEKKKKIVTINCVNGEKSTGTLIKEIDENLSDKYNFFHFFELGKAPKSNSYLISSYFSLYIHYKIARFTGLYFWFGIFPTLRMIQRIKRINPDIIHIHCPNMGTVQLPMLLKYAANNKIPVVFTNHCEVFYTSGCWHSGECERFRNGCGNCPIKHDDGKLDFTSMEWKILNKSYSRLNSYAMVAVSPWQKKRMDISGLLKGNCKKVSIYNGVNTKIFFERKNDYFRSKIDSRTKRKYKYLALHATSCFTDNERDMKGGHHIIKLAGMMDDVLFVVVGENKINDYKLIPENVVLEGYISDICMMAEYYSAADVCVITSRRETFGMTCAESLCCGTPVVGFSNGGSESMADKRYSTFVPYGNTGALREAIYARVEDECNKSISIEEMHQKYGVNSMVREYEKLYEEMIN